MRCAPARSSKTTFGCAHAPIPVLFILFVLPGSFLSLSLFGESVLSVCRRAPICAANSLVWRKGPAGRSGSPMRRSPCCTRGYTQRRTADRPTGNPYLPKHYLPTGQRNNRAASDVVPPAAATHPPPRKKVHSRSQHNKTLQPCRTADRPLRWNEGEVSVGWPALPCRTEPSDFSWPEAI